MKEKKKISFADLKKVNWKNWKTYAVIFLSLALVGAVVGIGIAVAEGQNQPKETTPEITSPENTTPEETSPEQTTPEETTPEQTTPEDVDPPVPAPAPKKILAIGNSFSVDAMEHLAEILVGEGHTDFVLGNLYIGGCALDGHTERIDSGAADYDFYLNTGSGWSSSKQNFLYGLEYTDWDVVTIQQVSGYSGIPESFDNLQYIVDYVRITLNDPDLKIYWHMTWAYQGNSNHSDFSKYSKDQMTMYNAIVDTVEEKVLTNYSIDGVIPSGTAIQNLRTSYLGDTLTRDGYHLSTDIGRYTAALTWYKELMRADLSELTVVPQAFSYIEPHLSAIKEAVNNAVEKPLEVTASSFNEYTTALTDADKEYLTGLGLNPDDYGLLYLGATLQTYYNSTSQSASVLFTGDATSKKYAATKIFTSETLPVGSIIHVLDGYRYRLEGWQTMNTKNSLPRLANSPEDLTVDESLYTKYSYIGFNISKTDGSAIAAADLYGLRIYVPKTN